MTRFPVDAPQEKVVKALQALGFAEVRRGNHIAMERANEDETKTPLTLPNHRTLKGSTLRAILTQSGITRDDFLAAYEQS